VLHFKWWGTGNDLAAFSPMEPLRRTLMVEDAAQCLTASYENGARPSGVLVTDQQLKPDSTKRLQEQTASLYGGVDNAFKLAVQEGGLDWKPMSHSLVDAQVVDTRRLTRERRVAWRVRGSSGNPPWVGA
jgi:HK97 family phage portal protein